MNLNLDIQMYFTVMNEKLNKYFDLEKIQLLKISKNLICYYNEFQIIGIHYNSI